MTTTDNRRRPFGSDRGEIDSAYLVRALCHQQERSLLVELRRQRRRAWFAALRVRLGLLR